jgi:hypothetical protein
VVNGMERVFTPGLDRVPAAVRNRLDPRMLAVLVVGSLFGFIGMLLAVPVTAALSVFWADLRDLYLRSKFFRGRPA